MSLSQELKIPRLLVTNLIWIALVAGVGYEAYRSFSGNQVIVGVAWSFGLLCILFIAFSKSGGEEKKIADLINKGEKIMTQVKALDMENVGGGGPNPTVVFTQDASGKEYKSESIWYNPTDSRLYNDPRFKAWQQLRNLNPVKTKCIIPVYINPKDGDDYYVDFANLEMK